MIASTIKSGMIVARFMVVTWNFFQGRDINDKKNEEGQYQEDNCENSLLVKEKAQWGRGMPSDLSEGEISEDWKSNFTFKWGKQIG